MTCAALQRDLVALALVVFVLFLCIFGLDGHKQSFEGLLTRRTDLHEAARRNTKHIASVQFCVSQHKLTGKRWKQTLHKIAKGLVVERPWPLQCHTFPCPGQKRSCDKRDKTRDTIFNHFHPSTCGKNARLGQLEVFEQPCASPRFVAMAPTRRPATFCVFVLVSCRHFFKSICGRELAMQIAEVLYVLESSQILTWTQYRVVHWPKGNYILSETHLSAAVHQCTTAPPRLLRLLCSAGML